VSGKVIGAWVGVLALAGAALGVKLAVDAQRPRGTDQQQLQQMLFQGEQAAERRDPAGINRLISSDYSDSIGMSDTSMKYQINRYLRRQQSVQVAIPLESIQTEIAPDGRTGTVRFQVNVVAQSRDGTVPNNLSLVLKVRKEPVFYFWVFPGEEWRVISVEGHEGYVGIE
jgi:hypothetical protein